MKYEGITQLLYLINTALCVKLFPEMKNAMGLSGVFFFYGVFAIFNAIYGWKKIPDNRGKILTKVGQAPDERRNTGHENPLEIKKTIKFRFLCWRLLIYSFN